MLSGRRTVKRFKRYPFIYSSSLGIKEWGKSHVGVERRVREKGHWCWDAKGSSFSESIWKNRMVNTDSVQIDIK